MRIVLRMLSPQSWANLCGSGLEFALIEFGRTCIPMSKTLCKKLSFLKGMP